MRNLGRLSEYLSQAILLEVSAYPKPGLVTRQGNGAHRDMSLVTFMMSSVVVGQAFQELFALGCRFEGDEAALFQAVREHGVGSEQKLLAVTKNVNTQRGILFAGGLLAAAGGFLQAGGPERDVDAAAVCRMAARMTAGIVKKELQQALQRDAVTYGEKLYQKYKITGIRGEVEAGFPSVRNAGLPAMRAAFASGMCINDALVHTLISLMTVVEDSNVIWRTDYETLARVQKRATEVLMRGSIFTSQGRTAIEAFDHDCIERRISPGGSADLLSVTTALYLLENGEFPAAIM